VVRELQWWRRSNQVEMLTWLTFPDSSTGAQLTRSTPHMTSSNTAISSKRPRLAKPSSENKTSKISVVLLFPGWNLHMKYVHKFLIPYHNNFLVAGSNFLSVVGAYKNSKCHAVATLFFPLDTNDQDKLMENTHFWNPPLWNILGGGWKTEIRNNNKKFVVEPRFRRFWRK
jgi:hypothetical protein